MFKANDQIGPYILIRQLGKGAFGAVWLAEKRSVITTTKVAIKLPLEEAPDLSAIKREADLWVEIGGHPNILPIIDADIYDGQVVIVSEYAPDGSLEEWIKNHGGKAPSLESAILMECGILAGLDHLHSKNILHRDLKPGNILLQGEIPRLADFGLSRILKSSANSTKASGTPAYMSPEAFDGKKVAQTDIWAAGIIFYQLLTGTYPFPFKEYSDLLGSILTKEPAPLPQTIPEDFQPVITKSLRKDPAERYQTAEEMKTDLEALLISINSAQLRNQRQKNLVGQDSAAITVNKADTNPQTQQVSTESPKNAITVANAQTVTEREVEANKTPAAYRQDANAVTVSSQPGDRKINLKLAASFFLLIVALASAISYKLINGKRTIESNPVNKRVDAQADAQPGVAKQNHETNNSVKDFDPKSYYRLTTKFTGSGLSLDIDENDQKKVYMEKSDDLTGQYWKITPMGDGYYRLTTKFTGIGMSLDIDENNQKKVYMEISGDLAGQYWKITPLGDGYYRLTTKFTGNELSLDIDENNQKKVYMEKSDDLTGQYWKITKIE
jgi:serine/threonine protein kinase